MNDSDLDAAEYAARANLARAARSARIRNDPAAHQAHAEAVRTHAVLKARREITRLRSLPLTPKQRAELAELLSA